MVPTRGNARLRSVRFAGSVVWVTLVGAPSDASFAARAKGKGAGGTKGIGSVSPAFFSGLVRQTANDGVEESYWKGLFDQLTKSQQQAGVYSTDPGCRIQGSHRGERANWRGSSSRVPRKRGDVGALERCDLVNVRSVVIHHDPARPRRVRWLPFDDNPRRYIDDRKASERWEEPVVQAKWGHQVRTSRPSSGSKAIGSDISDSSASEPHGAENSWPTRCSWLSSSREVPAE